MLKLGRVTKVNVFFLVLLYVFYIDLFDFGEGSIPSSAIFGTPRISVGTLKTVENVFGHTLDMSVSDC